jgi:hypothetical protein
MIYHFARGDEIPMYVLHLEDQDSNTYELTAGTEIEINTGETTTVTSLTKNFKCMISFHTGEAKITNLRPRPCKHLHMKGYIEKGKLPDNLSGLGEVSSETSRDDIGRAFSINSPLFLTEKYYD